MSTMAEQVACWTTLGVLMFAVWLSFDNAPFASEIVVYQGWCPAPRNEAGICQSGEEAGNPITYKASQETQSVVYWFKDQAPSHIKNCAIRDAKNWSCNQDEKYSTVMVDGNVSQTSNLGSIFYQVPKYKWYWLWLHTKTF